MLLGCHPPSCSSLIPQGKLLFVYVVDMSVVTGCLGLLCLSSVCEPLRHMRPFFFLQGVCIFRGRFARTVLFLCRQSCCYCWPVAV